MDRCPLCNLEQLTRWYLMSDYIIICDDLTSLGHTHRILGVMRNHESNPGMLEKKLLEEKLRTIADMVIGKDKYNIDYKRNTIPQHYHIQAESHQME